MLCSHKKNCSPQPLPPSLAKGAYSKKWDRGGRGINYCGRWRFRIVGVGSIDRQHFLKQSASKKQRDFMYVIVDIWGNLDGKRLKSPISDLSLF